jgi:DNA-binding GntR family transcriptional regulator
MRSREEQERPASRQTKHRQVFEHVLTEIESEAKRRRSPPIEAELVRQFSASRPTSRPGHCAIFKNLGLVERKVGSGTIVRKTQKPIESWRFGLLSPGPRQHGNF